MSGDLNQVAMGDKEQVRPQLEHRIGATRRKLLAALGTGGLASVAGCGGDGDGDGGDATTTTTEQGVPGIEDTTTTTGASGDTATTTTTTTGTGDDTTTTQTSEGLAHVEGQTFRLPTGQNPEEVTFLQMDTGLRFYIEEREFERPGIIARPMWEPPMTGRWHNSLYWRSPDRYIPRLFDSMELLDDRLRCTINEDAYWSDGEPITAWDGAWTASYARVHGFKWDQSKGDANASSTYDDVLMPEGRDGKVFELVDKTGYLDIWDKAPIVSDMAARFGTGLPAHVEPFTDLAEAAWENIKAANRGEEPKRAQEMARNHVDKEHYGMWRDPDHVVTNGAWKLKEIRGSQEIVLEPNPEWRFADEVNFDEVRFSFVKTERRLQASLNADRLDYGSETLPPEVVESFPDTIEQVMAPGGGGSTIEFDLEHRGFGDVKVRHAIAYALNSEEIAKNVHPTATRPIAVPGGDTWARDAVVSDEWVEENLIDYSQDLERANQLMEEAGWTKQDGTWHKDGEPFELVYPTEAESPVFETTVVNQLQEFGINIQVQAYDAATYEERLENDEFYIWSGSWLTGFYNDVWNVWWHNTNGEWELYMRDIYPRDKYEKAVEGEGFDSDGYSESGWVVGQWKLWEDLYIDVPPVGNPDGPREQVRPSYMNGYLLRGEGELDQEWINKYMWIANWFLQMLPVYNQHDQHFIDTAHWNWPKDHYMWEYLDISIHPADMLAMNMITADPENPEGGANVVEE